MLVAIASGKGGTGKTSLSVNLTKILNSELNQKSVLVDLDVEEPNAGLFFKQSIIEEKPVFKKVPEWRPDLCSLCGKCQTLCHFNSIIQLPTSVLVFPEMCHSCKLCSDLCPLDALPLVNMELGKITHSKSELFDFIEGRLNVTQEMPTPMIKETIDYARKFEQEALLILDAPPGTSCSMIEAAKNSDFVILITEPTPFGFHDLKLAIETVEQLKKPFCVVINKYGIGNNEVENYCKKNGIRILGKIPHSRKAASLYSEGKMFIGVEEIETEIKNLAKQLLEIKV